jgi:predicted DNA binding protein
MNIIGEKVRLARQIRNKTITQLSEEVGVSKQAISQFENGVVEPKAETFFKLVQVLRFPIQFYIKEIINSVQIRQTFFRAQSSASALERKSYEERSSFVAGIYDCLEEYLNLPKLNLPKLSILNDEISVMEMENIAQSVRSYWNLGDRPILNLVSLLEENGIIVSTLKDGEKKIDGFTQVYQCNGSVRYCVMLEDEKGSMARRNFSAAHELGHILLHSSLNNEDLNSTENRQIERQANLFASCLLLPEKSFKKELINPNDYEGYLFLKKKWHVSIKAMFIRAKDLGLLSYDEYIILMKKYSYRIARSNKAGERLEPLDDLIEVEYPELFQTALTYLFENTDVDLDKFHEILSQKGLAADEKFLTSILSIEEDFFDKYHTNKKILNISVRN